MEATAAAPIMAPQVRLQSPLATDLTIEVLDIGMDAHITCGNRVTGYGEMASKCGFVAITSCEDTEPREGSIGATSAGLPNRDQSTRQTEGRSHEHFQKIVAPQIEARPEDEQGQRECSRPRDRIDHKQDDCAVESKKRM